MDYPNVVVVSLQSGFSGGAGVYAYCVGQCKKGEMSAQGSEWGEDYFLFSDHPGGDSKWLVVPDRLGEMLRLV